MRLFHVWFSLRRKTEMFFFLNWLLKILVSNHCVIWLKLVFDLASFNHCDFMIFFSKVFLMKKNDVFVVYVYCSPIFMNIQFDTLHIHHMHDAQQKNTHKLISIVIQNHKYLLKTKENFIRWFFGVFISLFIVDCVCVCAVYTVCHTLFLLNWCTT